MERSLDSLKDTLLRLFERGDSEVRVPRCYICKEKIPFTEEKIVIDIGVESRFFSDMYRRRHSKMTICYKCADKFSSALTSLFSYVSEERWNGNISGDAVIVEKIMEMVCKLIIDVVNI